MYLPSDDPGLHPGILRHPAAVLLYFFYLIITYQEELKTTLAEQELRITESRLFLLQEQMRPHFLFNSLGIIRSLVKKDKDRAIEAIDNFSDYLRVHVTALKDPSVVPFEKELEHVNSILAIVQSDYTKTIRVDYDLRYTNFRIPPLTLEPIVENAIKYGDEKEIAIDFSREENSLLLSVSNTGCTLPDTELPHIFDSFWRGSNAGSNNGSGLGLYICKQLMNRMNGDIFAEIKDGNMIVTAVFGMA